MAPSKMATGGSSCAGTPPCRPSRRSLPRWTPSWCRRRCSGRREELPQRHEHERKTHEELENAVNRGAQNHALLPYSIRTWAERSIRRPPTAAWLPSGTRARAPLPPTWPGSYTQVLPERPPVCANYQIGSAPLTILFKCISLLTCESQ